MYMKPWLQVYTQLCLLQKNVGADGRSRTGTACATAPSRQRVYQFHHIGLNFQDLTNPQTLSHGLSTAKSG